VSESLRSVGAITLFVEDPQRSKTFYQDVFDVPVLFEDENSAASEFENMVVNLLATPAAHELIDPAPVAGREVGSRFQLTIWVDDTDAVCAELTSRRVSLLNGPMNREWGMRTAAFTDPDGHIWEVAAKIPEGGKRPARILTPWPSTLGGLGFYRCCLPRPGSPQLPGFACGTHCSGNRSLRRWPTWRGSACSTA
jgi:lactoylglutathione lyase